MKKFGLYFLYGIIITAISSCSNSQTAYQFDDIYYNPKNQPIDVISQNSTEVLQTNTNSSDNYENSEDYGYSPFIESNSNNTAEETEYYNTEYAESIDDFNSPMRSFNTHDPYQRDRIMYTQDPYFQSPVNFNAMVTAAPFMPSNYFRSGPQMGVGFNSFSGWNVSMGYNWGWGNPYWGNSFVDPWGNPTNPWGNSFFWGPNFGMGWGTPGFGMGCPIYGWSAYNMAYRQGFNDGYYYGGRSSNTRYVNTPRGATGSRNYRSTNVSDTPRRVSSGSPTNTSPRSISNTPVQTSPTRIRNTEGTSVPSRTYNTSPNSNPTANPNATPRSSNPSMDSPNVRTRPTTPTRVNPSATPQSTQPARNSNYSSPSRATPQQPTRSNRTINRSRPSYNSNPSYSPSRNGSMNRMSSPRPSTRTVRPSRR